MTVSAATDDPRPLILHVIHHLVIGGMENGLVNLINHLPADRYRHAVVCIEDYSDFRQRIARPDVDVVALHRSRVGSGGVRRELFRLCRRLRPALVHSRNLSGLDALLPARLAGVPRTLHSEHGWDVDNLDGRKWKPAFLRRLHRPLVDHYITVSRDLQRFLVERIGVRASRITQIYNGVDTSRFVPAATRPHVEGLPPGFDVPSSVWFGSVGRIQPVKNQSALLHAFAAMVTARPDFRAVARLVLIGDGPLLGTLREQASTLGVADIVWMPGSSDQVPRWLQSLDVFVLPSLNEGISNTILEAMASGVPVLASRVGGNVELVREGTTGELFDPGDAPRLVALMRAYLESPELRRRHGESARRTALTDFSLDAMVAQYRSVYDRLCERRRSGH